MGGDRSLSVTHEIAARWLVELCRHDTTTGHEDRGLPALLEILETLEASVELQRVSEGRTNVLALWGAPRLLWSTHTDTVAPFVPPRRTAEGVTGRGAVDAKGQAVAQLAAIGHLLERGIDSLGWLGVVGEETDSVGATVAAELGERLEACEAVIVGEPTGCRLATGQRGIAQYRLEVKGRSAHSATPEQGRNALLALIDWLQALREGEPGVDDELGSESWNLGRVEGGGRPNVVPDRAVAEILARTVPASRFDERLRETAPEGAIVDLIHRTPADRFPPIGDFERVAVPFGSDAPRLRGLSRTDTVILVGPGRIEQAHTEHETLSIDELEAGIRINLELARYLLKDGEGANRS